MKKLKNFWIILGCSNSLTSVINSNLKLFSAWRNTLKRRKVLIKTKFFYKVCKKSKKPYLKCLLTSKIEDFWFDIKKTALRWVGRDFFWNLKKASFRRPNQSSPTAFAKFVLKWVRASNTELDFWTPNKRCFAN